MRVYFDASVLIAALLSPTGGSAKLLGYIKNKKLNGIISFTVIEEIVSHKGKLNKTTTEIEKFIGESGLLVRDRIEEREAEAYHDRIDPNDAHLIAGAKLTRCHYLVSLDKKHLLEPDIKKRFLPLKIVSPAELLARIKLSKGI